MPTKADGSFSARIHTDQANSAVITVTDRNNNSASQTIGVAVETAPGAAFEYDANGNTTKMTTSAPGQPASITTFEWDAWDRLVAIVKGTHRSEFTYNASGQRVRIKEFEGGAVISDTAYLWEGLKIVASSVNVSSGFDKFYFNDGFIDQNGSFYYSKDHLGSIRNVVNSSGAVVATYNYDAYGNVTMSGSDPGITHFLYTGHYYHAPSGVYLAPYRVYDPKIGRWLSREPLGLDGPNLYHYVFNSPNVFLDSTGLQAYAPVAPSPEAVAGMAEDVRDAVDDYLGNWDLPGPYGNPRNPSAGLEGWGDPLSFNRPHNGLGTTLGRGAYGVGVAAIGATCIVGAAEVATGNASTIFLGPASRSGGRLAGLRNPNWWKGKPWHIDYAPIPGSGKTPVLHINPPWKGPHWPLWPY